MLTDLVVKQLGLAVPLMYAAATYGVFHWLDKKASTKAKRAIAGWLRPLPYDKAAVASALIETFDDVYSRPLFAPRAFLRSALITCTVTIVLISEAYLLQRMVWMLWEDHDLTIRVLIGQTIMNILADYLSLFVIRRLLMLAGRRPMLALTIGPLIGIAIVVVLYSAYHVGLLLYLGGAARLPYNFRLSLTAFVVPGNVAFSILFAAIAVHLWLPLLAIALLIVKGFNSFLWAASGMRWFLKQGQQHPLQAVGYPAALIVFAVSTVIQVLWL